MIGASAGMYCIITTPEGKSVQLSQDSGYTDNDFLRDLPVISSVEITLYMKMATEVSVTLEMTYEQGIAFLNSPLCWPRNAIEVWVGYPAIGLYTPRIVGQVLKPEVSITAEGATVVLTVRGVEYESFRRSGIRQWRGKTTQDVLREIVETKYKKVLDISKDADQKMGKETYNFAQSQSTDWEFMRRLLEPWDCTLRFGTNEKGKPTVFVATQKEWTGEQPTKKFIMRGNFDVEKGEYPLLEFSTPSDWTWLASSSKSILSMDIDVDKKDVVKSEAVQKDSEVPKGGLWSLAGKVEDDIVDAAGAIPKFEEETAGKFIPMTSRDPTVQGRLQAKNDRAARDAGIQAECQSIGVPDMKPGEMVELVVTFGGEGALLDGNYGVTQVKHSVGGGSWDMSFTAFKGGFGKNVKIKGANKASVVADKPAKSEGTGLEKKAEPVG